MSNYFLEQVMTYLREGKIKVASVRDIGGEICLHYLLIQDLKTFKKYKFRVRKSDIEVMKFMSEVEGLENAFRC